MRILALCFATFMVSGLEVVMDKQFIRGKQRARKLVLQALYQWAITGEAVHEIEAQFLSINNVAKVDVPYFSQLLRGIVQHLEQIEQTFQPFLDRPIDSLSSIELAVLRLGTYELLYCPEIPYKVILDEAVTLTKAFGTQEGHRYVNGVLNNLAKPLRTLE